jgi:hypothetical protein
MFEDIFACLRIVDDSCRRAQKKAAFWFGKGRGKRAEDDVSK